jgi:type II secretory pathway component PulM
MANAPIAGGPGAFIERQLESLSPRDRKLLIGLVSFIAVVFVSVLWYSLYSVLNDKVSRVRETKSQLEAVRILDAERVDAMAKLESAEARLAQYKGKRVSAHIEEVAQKRDIPQEQLRAVNEVGSEQVGKVKQTTYKVDLKGLDYSDAYGFIYELETSGYPVHVQTADFRKTFVKKEKKLNVTLELVVFELAEG